MAAFSGCSRALTGSSNTPPSDHPGAMAYAHPYEAVNIFVLYDRIEKSADGPIQASTFLAHVMTHEITHLLQGMPFGPEDLDLIQLGLRRLAAVAGSAGPPAPKAELR
jgi:hypothetical protein